MTTALLTAPDGTRFRDLNHNGTMEPYEDPRLSPDERSADLVSRMSVAEKVGLMFQPSLPAAVDGTLIEGDTPEGAIDSHGYLTERFINHVGASAFSTPEIGAQWNNRVQEVAASTRLGIPVTLTTDPRNALTAAHGTGVAAKGFSQWPDALGLAALRSEDIVRDFADIARQEYVATGLRAAIHPQLDLPTHPRWARQFGSLGVDPELAARLGVAYVEGFQRSAALGPDSVSCIAKHFPGGGAQRDGEDPHFVYGREQVYPGGRFEDHLLPFRAAVDAGTAGIMPYYGMPVGLRWHGIDVPEVGFSFNRVVLQDMLREDLGFTGVIVTDYTLVTDGVLFGRPSIGRAWGVEHLSYRDRVRALMDSGVDQIGGESCTELLLDLVESAEVPESRLDESARRILRVKFQLGLFEDPFVDVDRAADTVGRADFIAAARRVQSRSVTVLTNRVMPAGRSSRGRAGGAPPSGAAGRPALPLSLEPGASVFADGIDAEAVRARGFVPAEAPETADAALVRLRAPYTPRDEHALEAFFRAGTLTFDPAVEERIAEAAAATPTIVDVRLDRPAMLAPIAATATALTASWGTADDAWLDAVLGVVPPQGRLPIEVPSSERAVDEALADVPAGTPNPLFPLGHGLEVR